MNVIAVITSSDSLLDLWSHKPVLLGLAFGLLHAFDADHVSAIGGLAVNDRATSPLHYAVRWAVGHAAALALIAIGVLGIGLMGLAEFSRYAEALVAATLVAVGLLTLRRLSAGSASPARIAHERTSSVPLGRRAGLLMGMLHGGAGSAAVIALIPLTAFDSGLTSGLYLGFFSLGVAAGACVLSGALAGFFACTDRRGVGLRRALHGAIGVAATLAGVMLGLEWLHGG